MNENELIDAIDDIQHQLKWMEEELIKIKEFVGLGYLEDDDAYDYNYEGRY